ncbi:MAG: hypothetical protein GC150_09350 [Rhizobiales bacterium]|nr:hypothetical protein [Hyphomicrobiales bacterium]
MDRAMPNEPTAAAPDTPAMADVGPSPALPRPLDIVLFYEAAAMHTGTVRDHVTAFERLSGHRVHTLDVRAAAELAPDLTRADALVLHYSLVIAGDAYVRPSLAEAIAAFTGPKILFIQDEYRWVDRTAETIRLLGVHVVFTVVNEDVIRRIYRAPWLEKVRFEQTLTGFVPEDLVHRPVPAYTDRPIDVSYRARRVPAWLGAFAQEKWWLGARFREDARRHGLVCDIETSEASRIYGERWIEFVANSKAVLGSESGASFVDFAGDVQPLVEAFERDHPDAPFEEVQHRFLGARDGEIVIRVISPRCFEAAALRTLMILYPGDYSGVLEPGRHYVPLARDHSNMDEVVAIIRDPVRASAVIERAWQEVAQNPRWTFASFIAHFDRVVEQEHARLAASPEQRAADLDPSSPQVLAGLSRAAADLARNRSTRMGWTLRLMRAAGSADAWGERHVPASVYRPLRRAGRLLVRAVKPLLKRLLLGRQ